MLILAAWFPLGFYPIVHIQHSTECEWRETLDKHVEVILLVAVFVCVVPPLQPVLVGGGGYGFPGIG